MKKRKEIREGQKWQCHETYQKKKRKLFHVITNSFSLFHHREFYKFENCNKIVLLFYVNEFMYHLFQ